MGTKRVVVLPYDEQWKQDFLNIKAELADALGQLATAIIGAVVILWIASFFKK